MLAKAVESYVSLRRAVGFAFKSEGSLLISFAKYSDARRKNHLRACVAIEWAGQAQSSHARAHRLATVIRFARHVHAEDPRHDVPPAVFGREKKLRPTPYIMTQEQILQLIHAASRSGYRTLRRATYSTLFSLLSCTGLRLSEALRLRLKDITPDGLVIRDTKFKKSRLVPLHETAHAGLERYLRERIPYAPTDDHVFVSLRRKPLLLVDVANAFRLAVKAIGLPVGPGGSLPTPHSLRHAFAVRALQACPDSRDSITQHMVALSTYLGHSNVSNTYWYLEAVPDLMVDIADRCEHLFMRTKP